MVRSDKVQDNSRRRVNDKKIYLAAPYLSGNEKKYVQQALDSNWIAPLGPFVERLEHDISKTVGVSYAVALSSGTSAIHMALIEAGVKEGDYVFCSDFTFTASANPIRYCGATPVFIDAEAETFGMSPSSLEKAFVKYKPKAVVVASLYGVPAKLEEISQICEKHGATMIEDSTEVLGSTLNGKSAGTFGKFGTFSFNGNKIITTSGGGMLVSNDEQSIAHAFYLSTQAKDSKVYYSHSELGYNYRLSNISAAIGVAQLEQLDYMICLKKRIYERYKQAFEKYEMYGVGMADIPDNCTSNYWLSVLKLGDRSFTTPEEVVKLLEKNGIEARTVWKPMHTQMLWEGCDYIYEGESCSEHIFSHALCLPSDLNMAEDEQNAVINAVSSILDDKIKLYYHQGY